ncbi:hypothetical protein LCGC14_0580970 [marine sediment metagenome]|uniref:Xylose isomerase-like TIM barrel domain-containing protein n=1 Tax=marine sediment metagenome TaxID=412755 RepID=A0A0F9U2J8_9ZZZZ|nr:deoxyribonuclease IV [Phycisphaerae bacterium]HDZ44490.1 deoxyribonuclease IV [Phycisphaerae bacterium]
MILGSHLSIAGGTDRALVAAADYGFDTVALFVRNQRQWKAPPLTDEAARLFRRTRRRLGISPVVAHGSYLVNLAGDQPVRRKSLVAVADELDRCGRLGIDYLVMHPGANPKREQGIARIAAGLNASIANCRHRRVKILLETTSGAGNSIGGRFEDLAAIFEQLDRKGRFGVCLDTCHIFAAGYDLRTARAYRQMMAAFDAIIGAARLMAVHVNDSLGDLASHRDRHAHIGAGRIGLRGLANLVNDPRLRNVPMILETPKGTDPAGGDWDAVNAAALRGAARA